MMTTVIEDLKKVLQESQILVGKDLESRYAHIWTMHTSIKAMAVLLPKSTADVSEICKVCSRHDQNIVVHGGLTNLTGSTQTDEEEIVVSLEKMNQIEEIDESNRTMTVQAGVILENIHTAAAAKNFLFPLSYGAKGSAQIGGAISTNAGGLRVLRYGMTRQLILGLETVLADGTIISSMKKIIKDNSGYDLKQLFIGAEGTLGIVTRAVLKLHEAPASRNSAFVAFDSFDEITQFLRFVDKGLAGTLSAFELIWSETYTSFTSTNTGRKPPLFQDYPYYVLIESLGSDQVSDHAQMQSLLEEALLSDMILDGVMAHSESDQQLFWTIREDVAVLLSYSEFAQHFDVSVPIEHMHDYVENVKVEILKLEEVVKVFPFGHLADGNIHFVVAKTTDDPKITFRINEIVYRPLSEFGGSVSAEHGIGVDKKGFLQYSRSTSELALMATLKKALDPKGLLNQGKIFD